MISLLSMTKDMFRSQSSGSATLNLFLISFSCTGFATESIIFLVIVEAAYTVLIALLPG
jgi:hypothetical protein